MSTTRILLPTEHYDRAVSLARDYADRLVVGDPADPQTDVGPLVSRRQQEAVAAHVRRALEQGATLVAGGELTGAPHVNGFYYAPTILSNVTPEMDIAKHEVFGPVIALMRYDTVDEAVRIANDTDYGLASAVWGTDLEQATEVSDRLEAGLKWINDVGQIDVGRSPMARRKASGLGVELGADGLFAYTLPSSTYSAPANATQSAVYGLVGSRWDAE